MQPSTQHLTSNLITQQRVISVSPGEVLGEIGPAAINYAQKVIPVLTEGLADTTEAVRRNSAFCVGVLIESTGEALVPHFPSILEMLHPVCVRTCMLSGAADSGGADIDNAIAAVTRMIKVAPASLPLQQVLTTVLAALPIKADFNEAKQIFSTLCDLLDSDNAATVPLMATFLNVFAKTLTMSKIEDEVKARLVSTIYRLATGPPAHIFSASVQTVSPEHQAIIQQALQAHRV